MPSNPKLSSLLHRSNKTPTLAVPRHPKIILVVNCEGSSDKLLHNLLMVRKILTLKALNKGVKVARKA